MDANALASAWLAEDAPLVAARARAGEVGVGAVTPAGGSLLAFLAAHVDAKAVVETGTGTGVSGLWLLRGMRHDGALTSVDVESEHQRLARTSFTEAGIPASRARLITGDALAVLPRLADHAYDLVLLDAAPQDYVGQLEQARRLLRPGGVVVVAGVLRAGRGIDAVVRDGDALAVRDLLEVVKADEDLVPALLPIGDGMLVLGSGASAART